MEDETGSLVLLALIQRLHVRGEVVGVTLREGVGLLRPVHCSGVQLLGRILLDKGPGLSKQLLGPRRCRMRHAFPSRANLAGRPFTFF